MFRFSGVWCKIGRSEERSPLDEPALQRWQLAESASSATSVSYAVTARQTKELTQPKIRVGCNRTPAKLQSHRFAAAEPQSLWPHDTAKYRRRSPSANRRVDRRYEDELSGPEHRRKATCFR